MVYKFLATVWEGGEGPCQSGDKCTSESTVPEELLFGERRGGPRCVPGIQSTKDKSD